MLCRIPCLLLLLVGAVDTFTSPSPHVRSLLSRARSQNSILSSTSTSTSTSTSLDDDDDFQWKKIEDIEVQTLDGKTVGMGDVVQTDGTVILSCLSHFGDFNAWELTQQYLSALDSEQNTSNSPVVLVGIGSVTSAQKFAQDLGLEKYSDRLTLLADETGAISEALGCYRGWLAVDQQHKERYPHTDINPYVKLLGMIFGFGSPGTIGKVMYGYTGDTKDENGPDGRKWVVNSLLQGSEKGRLPKLSKDAFSNTPALASLRPFELATLRLQTGLHIVSHWGKLGPKNGDLFTRMGGTFVFNEFKECAWSFFDQGILCYADVDEVFQVARATSNFEIYIAPTKEEKITMRKAREEILLRQQIEESARSIAAKEAKIRVAQELLQAKQEQEEGRKDNPKFFMTSQEEAALARKLVEEEEEQQLRAEGETSLGDQAKTNTSLNLDNVGDEPAKTKERFHRLLLEARFKYEKTARATVNSAQPKEETVPNEGKEQADLIQQKVAAQSTEEHEGELEVQAKTTADPNLNLNKVMDDKTAIAKERFHRMLLGARLKYDKGVGVALKSVQPEAETVQKGKEQAAPKPILQAKEDVPRAPQLQANISGGPNSDEGRSEATKNKELFHRMLLEARLKYARAVSASEIATVVGPEEERHPVEGEVRSTEEAETRLQAVEEARQNAVGHTNQLRETVARFKEQEEDRLKTERNRIVLASDEVQPELPLQANATLSPNLEEIDTAKQKDQFHRNLLEERFKNIQTSKTTGTSNKPVSSNDFGVAVEDPKKVSNKNELFQRQLLEARFKVEKATKTKSQPGLASGSTRDAVEVAPALPLANGGINSREQATNSEPGTVGEGSQESSKLPHKEPTHPLASGQKEVPETKTHSASHLASPETVPIESTSPSIYVQKALSVSRESFHRQLLEARIRHSQAPKEKKMTKRQAASKDDERSALGTKPVSGGPTISSTRRPDVDKESFNRKLLEFRLDHTSKTNKK